MVNLLKDRRNVLIVRPPTQLGELVDITSSQHPVNLLWICAFLREHGYEPHLLDFEIEPYAEETVRKAVEDLDPLWVGVTAFTPLVVVAHEICRVVKEAFPEVPTVVGGPHPTAMVRETLEEFPYFDFAVQGEGEHLAVELSERLRRGEPADDLAGLASRVNGGIVVGTERSKAKDLDRFPMPARDLIEMDRYPGASKSGLPARIYRTTQVFTSRGCPFPCTFCAIFLTTSRAMRYRSLEHVERELLECRDRYGIQHISIHDDTFTVKEDRVAGLSRLLGRLGFTWDCDTRVDTVTQPMLDEMAAGGCLRVAFGVESGSERMMKLMKKNVTREQVRNAFAWSKEAGMMTSAYFIVGGHPDESPADIEETRSLMFEIKADFANVAIGTPYPGTELFEQLDKRGMIFEKAWDKYMLYGRLPVWRTENYSPEDLVRLQAQLIRAYFFRPAYIWQRLKRLRKVKELGYWIRSAMIGLRYVRRGMDVRPARDGCP